MVTSFGTVALFYSLRAAEQLHVSMRHNKPNRHATLTFDCLMLREKLKGRKTVSEDNL